MGHLAEVWERSSHLQAERKLFPSFIKNEIERIIYVLRDVLEMILLKLYGVVAEQGPPKMRSVSESLELEAMLPSKA